MEGCHIIDIYTTDASTRASRIVDCRHIRCTCARGRCYCSVRPGRLAALLTTGRAGLSTNSDHGDCHVFRSYTPVLHMRCQSALAHGIWVGLQDLPHVEPDAPITKFDPR